MQGKAGGGCDMSACRVRGMAQRCDMSAVQFLKIKVKDHDKVGSNDDLGEVKLDLWDIFKDGDREVRRAVGQVARAPSVARTSAC